MSDTTDNLDFANIEEEWDDVQILEYRRDFGRDMCWITRTGNEIPLRDMTDEHLNNAYNFLLRNDPEEDRAWTQILAREIKWRIKHPVK